MLTNVKTHLHSSARGGAPAGDPFLAPGVGHLGGFPGRQTGQGLSRDRLDWLKAELTGSLDHTQDAAYFAARLQAGEHWRLFRQFRPRTAYLDIETTGKVWPGLLVTVVGLYDGQNMRQFVQGFNLQEFPQALASFDLLVTFNGTQFDLPVLKAYFPGLNLPPAHVDLRFLMARLGFKGGLKKIEPRFGIRRPKAVNGMDGYMAVLLWQRYQRGERAPWTCSSPIIGRTWSTWKCSWTGPFGWSGSGSSPPARGRAACARRPGLERGSA